MATNEQRISTLQAEWDELIREKSGLTKVVKASTPMSWPKNKQVPRFGKSARIKAIEDREFEIRHEIARLTEEN